MAPWSHQRFNDDSLAFNALATCFGEKVGWYAAMTTQRESERFGRYYSCVKSFSCQGKPVCLAVFC